MIEKILLCLPKRFNVIVVVIKQITKGISRMSIDELVSFLTSFEERLSKQLENPIENAFQYKLNVNTKMILNHHLMVKIKIGVVILVDEETIVKEEEISMRETKTKLKMRRIVNIKYLILLICRGIVFVVQIVAPIYEL